MKQEWYYATICRSCAIIWDTPSEFHLNIAPNNDTTFLIQQFTSVAPSSSPSSDRISRPSAWIDPSAPMWNSRASTALPDLDITSVIPISWLCCHGFTSVTALGIDYSLIEVEEACSLSFINFIGFSRAINLALAETTVLISVWIRARYYWISVTIKFTGTFYVALNH